MSGGPLCEGWLTRQEEAVASIASDLLQVQKMRGRGLSLNAARKSRTLPRWTNTGIVAQSYSQHRGVNVRARASTEGARHVR
jgi:hypothetical protein